MAASVASPPSSFVTDVNDTASSVALTDVLFAADWDLNRTTAFMQNSWVPASYKIVLGYLAMVYFGQRAMKSRQAVDGPAMTGILAVWNFSFSLFSGWAAARLLPELYQTFVTRGFVGSYCDNASYYTDPLTGYWGWMFVMSKMPELGDTLFLVLRKKPVIFLHWYHHALTFVYATLTYAEMQAWCRWSLALNLSVHTIMYFYFGVQALKIRAPRWVAKMITTVQILQFVIQCYIYTQLVYIKTTESVPNCAASWNNLSLGALMYGSYLYLFAQFFYDSYLRAGGRSGGKQQKGSSSKNPAKMEREKQG